MRGRHFVTRTRETAPRAAPGGPPLRFGAPDGSTGVRAPRRAAGAAAGAGVGILQDGPAGAVVERPRWCPDCAAAVLVRITTLLPRPVDPIGRSRWDDAVRREVDAAYYLEHVPTHDAGRAPGHRT